MSPEGELARASVQSTPGHGGILGVGGAQNRQIWGALMFLEHSAGGEAL